MVWLKFSVNYSIYIKYTEENDIVSQSLAILDIKGLC